MSRSRLVAALVLLVALTAAACGVRSSGVITGEAAPSGPAQGAVLYLVSDGQLVRVLRPSPPGELSPADTIGMLARGPDVRERELRYTTEVPPGTVVIEPPSGPSEALVLTLSVDVGALSAMAVDQIVCTARDSYANIRQITLRGQGTERGPLLCPLPG